jgi:hypothetical protein
MAGPRYPLERVAALRADAAAATVRELAAALTDEADAEVALAGADDVVARAEAAVRGCTLDGAGPAWALARRDAYRARLVRELGAARDRRAARAATLELRRHATALARALATTARAEREVVDRHRAGWSDARRKARERAED